MVAVFCLVIGNPAVGFSEEDKRKGTNSMATDLEDDSARDREMSMACIGQ